MAHTRWDESGLLDLLLKWATRSRPTCSWAMLGLEKGATSAVPRRGWWLKEEGTEEERLEGSTRVALKFLEERCLHSSMQGKR